MAQMTITRDSGLTVAFTTRVSDQSRYAPWLDDVSDAPYVSWDARFVRKKVQ